MAYKHLLLKIAAEKRRKKLKLPPPPPPPISIAIKRPGAPPIEVPVKSVVRTGKILTKVLHME